MKTILKINEAVETTVEITTDEQIAYRNNEIAKLNKKIEALQELTDAELCDTMAKSVKTKLAKKIEAGETLQAEYVWSEVAGMRRSKASFSAYLTELGIDKTLHGSANRALTIGKATLAGLKLAKIDDAAILREAAENAIGGKNAAWRQAVLDWLLDGNTETEEAETE